MTFTYGHDVLMKVTDLPYDKASPEDYTLITVEHYTRTLTADDTSVCNRNIS